MERKEYTVYDEKSWPIVVITAPKHVSERDFEEHLLHIERYYDRRQPFALVLDMRGSDDIGPNRRKAIADLIRNREDRSPRQLRGVAFVVDSAFQRVAVKGILWLCPPGSPMEPFTTVPAAFAWTRTKVIEAPSALEPRSDGPVLTLEPAKRPIIAG